MEGRPKPVPASKKPRPPRCGPTDTLRSTSWGHSLGPTPGIGAHDVGLGQDARKVFFGGDIVSRPPHCRRWCQL